MTKTQAQRLMIDLGKNLTHDDYCEDLYISINNIGTRTFKKCAYFECEGYTFIWTPKELFLINKKKMNDLIIIPKNTETMITIKKVT
jgi:hypothetical protein